MNRLFLIDGVIFNVLGRSNSSYSTTIVRNAAAFKAATTSGKKRFRQPVRDDAEYLVSHVSGSNIFKTGEDIQIKDDSEYPDWIWTARIDRFPLLEELDPNTKEYWELLRMNSCIRTRRLMKVKLKDTMRVGTQQRKKLELLQRFKHRALPPEDMDMGFDPSQVIPKPDKKLWLRPQPSFAEEEVYPDEFVKENPDKFVKENRPWDYEGIISARDKRRKRKWY
jgi:large subunit ribosomal protein L54